MKLHLSLSFRKALLACLAPTLISSAAAADFTPTLDRLHATNPQKYPTPSAYTLTEVTDEDAYTFCTYEVAADGSLTPHYYLLNLKDAAEEGGIEKTLAYQFVWDEKSSAWSFGQTTDPSLASIVYTSEEVEQNKHITYTPGVTVLRDADAANTETKAFQWQWVEFGINEKDDKFIDPDKKSPVNPEIGQEEYRWLLVAVDDYDPAAHQSEAVIEYRYSPEANQQRLLLSPSDQLTNLEGIFVDNAVSEGISRNDVIENPEDIVYHARGGAVYNAGAIIGNISGDYIGNSVQSLFYTDGRITTTLHIENEASGGAIYHDLIGLRSSSGAITSSIGSISGVYMGNYAYARYISFSNTEYTTRTFFTLRTKGGAIYHGLEGEIAGSGNISASISDITGSFIGNHAKAEVSEYKPFYGLNEASLYAMGGAIYNGVGETSGGSNHIEMSLGNIVGNFIGNYVYNDHFTWVVEGTVTTYTFGGAIYNGIIDVSQGKEQQITSSAGSVSGNFVGNFVYDVNPYYRELGEYGKNHDYTPPGGAGEPQAKRDQRALGGAVYNGSINIADTQGNTLTLMGDIQGIFTGNYAYVKNYSSTASILLGQPDPPKHTYYALGGAVYNGMVGIQSSAGNFRSVTGDISGDFTGNYVHTVKVCAEQPSSEKDFAFGGAIYNGIVEIVDCTAGGNTSSVSTGSISGVFADNYSYMVSGGRRAQSAASGGAIYNGLNDISESSGIIRSSVIDITGYFTGNYAFTKNDASGQLSVVKRNSAKGGAIYNGIAAAKEVSANIETVIENGITGDFISNYVSVTSYAGGKDYAALSSSVKLQNAFGGAIYNGINNISNNAQTISSSVAHITGDFIQNSASAYMPEDSYGSQREANYAFGGAIYNGIADTKEGNGHIVSSVTNIIGNFTNNQVTAQRKSGKLKVGSNTDAYYAFGGAIYNGIMDVNNSNDHIESTIQSITGDFTDNAAMAIGASYMSVLSYQAYGGAIYNGIGTIDGSNSNNISSSIDNINGDFVHNHASTEGGKNKSTLPYYAFGGAVYNGISVSSRNNPTIDNSNGSIISSIGAIRGDFIGNYASSVWSHAKGGAVYNGISDIQVTSNTNGTILASITTITGNFVSNEAKSTDSDASGGALYNGVDIKNAAGGGTVEAYVGAVYANFIGNRAGSANGKAYGGAVYNAGSIGRLASDGEAGEFDGSTSGGIVNSSFIENCAESSSASGAQGGAIYTSADLILTDKEAYGRYFITGNQEIEGSTERRAAIYVEGPATLYVNVYNGSKLHVDDEIWGSKSGYTLRMRGYEQRKDASEAHAGVESPRSGTIYLNNMVQQADAIMDDEHLYIGHAEINRAWINGDKLHVAHDSEGDELGGDIISVTVADRAKGKGERTYLDDCNEGDGFRRRTNQSDAFSASSLNVRSGAVHLTDSEGNKGEAFTEYIFGNLTAYGSDYTYAQKGNPSVKNAYDNSYAKFEFGVNLSQNKNNAYTMTVEGETRKMVQSDVVSVFAQLGEDGKVNMAQSASGRITLHGLTVAFIDSEVWSLTRKPFSNVNPDYPNEDPNNTGAEYNRDVYAQLINFVLLDKDGHKLETSSKAYEEFAKGFTAGSDLLQLTDAFNKVDYVQSYARSSWILCNNIELATTKTLNDSIHIVDWRDILAEWAEQKSSYNRATYTGDYAKPDELNAGAGFAETKGDENGWKRFVLDGVYYLNRNINIKDNPTDLHHEPDSAKMWGKNLEIASTTNDNVIDLQNHNLLHMIAAEQNVYLRNFELRNVQNKVMQNLGSLTLNSMDMGSSLVVNNQNELTIAGYTNIYYTITARAQKLDAYGNPIGTDAEYDANGTRTDVLGDDRSGVQSADPYQNGKKMTISHEADDTGAAKSITHILGTVEYQNIYHREKAKSTLPLKQTDGVWAYEGNFADAYDTVTYLNTTGDDGVTTTKAFDQFKMNELNMYGGAFALGAMHTNRLQLRNFTIQGGGVFVDSSTIDIAEGKEVMGGIDVISGGTAKYGSSASTGDTAYEPRAASANSGTGNGLIWLQSFTIQGSSEKNIIHVKFVDPGVADAVKDGMGVANGGKPSGAVNMEDGDHIWIWQVTYNDEKAPQKGMYTLVRGDETTPGGPGGPSGPGIAPGNPTTPEVNDGAVSDLVGSYVSMMQVYNYAFEHADLYSASLYQARRQDFYSKHHTVVTPTKNGKGAESPEEEAACRPALARMGSGLWLQTYASTETMPLRNGPHVRNEMYGALLGTDSDLVEHRNGWVSVYSLYGGYLGSTQRYQSVRIRQNGGALGGTATFYKERFYTALTATIGTSSAAATGRYGHEDYDLFMGGIASRTGYNIELDDEGDYILQPTLLVSYSCFSASDYTNASGVKMDSRPVGTLQFHPYLKLISNKDCRWKPYATLGYVHDVMGKTKFRANGMHLPSMGIRPYVEYSIGTQYLWSDAYTIYGQIIGRNGGRNGMEVNLGLRWSW